MDVDLRPAAELVAGDELVDAVGGDGAVADGGGEEVRTDDVASDRGYL
jgi:hypothetical protein